MVFLLPVLRPIVLIKAPERRTQDHQMSNLCQCKQSKKNTSVYQCRGSLKNTGLRHWPTNQGPHQACVRRGGRPGVRWGGWPAVGGGRPGLRSPCPPVWASPLGGRRSAPSVTQRNRFRLSHRSHVEAWFLQVKFKTHYSTQGAQTPTQTRGTHHLLTLYTIRALPAFSAKSEAIHCQATRRQPGLTFSSSNGSAIAAHLCITLQDSDCKFFYTRTRQTPPVLLLA